MRTTESIRMKTIWGFEAKKLPSTGLPLIFNRPRWRNNAGRRSSLISSEPSGFMGG